jgi:hypothetical protein
MTVHRNKGRWDTSNVIFDGRRVVRYAKGLLERPVGMCWIDYGLTALRRSVLAERVPPATVSDLAPVLAAVAAEGQLTGFEVPDRFYEIRSPQGRAELEALLREQPPRCRQAAGAWASAKSDRIIAAHHEQTQVCPKQDLTLTKVHAPMGRQGVVVSYRTLRRYATTELGFGQRQATVPGRPRLRRAQPELLVRRDPCGAGVGRHPEAPYPAFPFTPQISYAVLD